MRKLTTLALTSFAFMATLNANASGFQLLENSASGLGRAYAGIGVMGDDYSAISFNPAGMMLKDSGSQIGVTLLNIKNENKGHLYNAVTHTPVTPYGNKEVILNEQIPHIFAQYKLAEKIRVGLGVYAPFGLSTNYNKKWIGGIHAIDSNVEALDITPSVAYQVTPTLSLGAGVNVQRFSAVLSQNLALDGSKYSKVKADDWGVGYNIGAMFKKDTFRAGISYRTRIKHKLEGWHKIRGMAPVTLRSDGYAFLTTPESVIMSAAYEMNQKVTLSAMAKWTKWSRFDTLNIHSDLLKAAGKDPSVTEERWKNTWYYALGADYKYNEKWTFRTGFGYDETPINGSEYRTARIPDNNRIWLSVGTSYTPSKAWKFDVGYTFMAVHDASARHTIAPTQLDVKYHTRAHLLAFQAQYSF